MAEEEPPAKKAKPTGWEDHKLNISEAVMKADEGKFLSELSKAPISTIQGIGPKSETILTAMGLKTVEDLATYKFFLMSRALATLAETEVKDDRPSGSVMNVDKAVDKEYEPKTLTEIVEAPISALEGLTENAEELLKEFGVKSVGDLATWKYCRWAEAIVEAAKYEEIQTKGERKTAAALKKLA
uniref:Uncharacterized protein n=1 Tax=Cyclophora tenuis TaxID=216820 RepID=A0A7S1D6K2_CYCTE|mmetsp:Transcript_22858/g.38888  ORF Transcript_22858/g.38888 Transcript_22858/m.38888 type:complete len:185 (+) Transcript_22858:34-588(+)